MVDQLGIGVAAFFAANGLSNQIQWFFFLSVMTIMIVCFDLMNALIPCLSLPVLLSMLKIVPANVAFAPYTTPTPWVILSLLIIMMIITRNGLLNRVAYKILILCGGTFKGVLFGMFCISFIGNFLLAGNATNIMVFLGLAICSGLDMKGTKTGGVIMYLSVLFAAQSGVLFYSPVSIGFIQNMMGGYNLGLDYWSYGSHMIIKIILPVLVTVPLYRLTKREDIFGTGKESIVIFKEKYTALGAMSSQERKALIVLLLVVVYMMTSRWHGLSIDWGIPIGLLLMYLPGINIGTTDDIRKSPYDLFIFVGGCLAIGNAAGALGLGVILSQSLMPILTTMSPTGFWIVVWFITAFLNIFLTPFALMALLPGPLTQIALDLGYSVNITIYALMDALDAIVLPHEAAQWMLMFSFGYCSMKQFITWSLMRCSIMLICLAVIFIPYWTFIGL